MTHQIQDFRLHKKRDKSLSISLLTSTGGAQNLTGVTVKWQLTKDVGETVIITKTSTSTAQINVTSSTGGLATLNLTSTDTDRYGVFYHECIITDSTGNDTQMFSGHVTIELSQI
jgi:hypothetical protein